MQRGALLRPTFTLWWLCVGDLRVCRVPRILGLRTRTQLPPIRFAAIGGSPSRYEEYLP